MIRKILLFILILGCLVNAAGKIVSLAPNLTEIICYLGGEKRLAAVTNDCNFPQMLSTKPKVGKYLYPDLEKIIKYKPALVVLEDTADERFLARLKEHHIRYKQYNLHDLAVFFTELKRINKDLGLNGSAKILSLKKIYDRQPKKARRSGKILILVWQHPFIAAGSDTFVSQYFCRLGYQNEVNQQKYPKINEELLYTNKLKVIINLTGKKLYLRKPTTAQVVQELDPDIYLRLSPRLIKAYENLPF